MRARRITALVTLGVLALAAVSAVPAPSALDPFEAMDVDRAGTPVPAPAVAFRALDGRERRLRALRGKVVLLGFFTTS